MCEQKVYKGPFGLTDSTWTHRNVILTIPRFCEGVRNSPLAGVLCLLPGKHGREKDWNIVVKQNVSVIFTLVL
jgi:hypothetical protein